MQAHNSAKPGSRKVFNSARHAARWLERGIYPIPVEAGSKRPKGDNWNKLRVTEETINRYFHNGDNIGGLWGEPSAWAIDVDLDTPEAQAVARYYLPETLIYGRFKAPASHYILRCRDAETRKYFTKEIGMIAEIRSTGSHTVLPGSTHPTGDRYRMDHDVEITDIKWADLKRRVGRIAGAAIAAHYYPDEGTRHDYVHTLTGALLHSYWKDADVRLFMEAVQSAIDDEEIKSDRKGTIENTIKSYHNGKNVKGWPSLADFMPGLSLQSLKRYLEIGNQMPDNDPVPDSIAAEPIDRFDDRLLDVPGLVGEVAKWWNNYSFVKQPLFGLAVGLMGVAIATKNRYRIVSLHTPLQPYMMCVAPTASGKDAVLDALYLIAEKVGLAGNCFKQSQSYHAMMDIVATLPRIAVWLWNECARYLRSAARSQGGQEYQVVTHMMSMYGKAATSVPGIPGRKNAIPPLHRPFFLVVGTAQPEQVLEAISITDHSTGFTNRFLLFDAGQDFVRDNEDRSDVFPKGLDDALKAFDKVKVAEGEFRDVEYEDYEAWEILNDLRTYSREEASKKDSGATIWGRAQQNALILAGLVAVGVDAQRPIITRAIANWAVRFSCWSIERWQQRIDQSSSRSFIERDSKYIERLIFEVRKHRSEVYGNKQELEMIDKGLCPHSFLMRKCRHIKTKDIEEIITHLMLADLIRRAEATDIGRSYYWPKTTRTNGA